MNEEIINSRWNLTRKELKLFQKWLYKQNKKTQDKIQDIFNVYDLSFDDLNKRISKVERDRLNRKIDEWIELGMYTGYFKYRAEELLNRLTYRGLLEILIYEVFIEEKMATLDEIKVLFPKISLDCYNQGLVDLNKKKVKKVPSILDKVIFETLIDGIMLEDYLNALYLTNAQEIQKQYLISKQQEKKIDVYSDLVQRTFEKQRNKLISINDNKYSGALDKYATALGNMAYIEAGGTDNQKVKFVSDLCDNVTKMCSHMNGMIFNTVDRNVFERPMGKTSSDLVMQTVDIKGLIVGINKPPITEHFHWCHSTLTYLLEMNSKGDYNVINKEKFISANGSYIEHINLKDIDNKLIEYENNIVNESVENMYVILPNGDVYRFIGTDENVKADGINLNGAIVTHNHPKDKTHFSLSNLDRMDFNNNNILRYRGIDYKYKYELNRNKDFKEEMPNLDDYIEDPELHIENIMYSYKQNIGYKRWNNAK